MLALRERHYAKAKWFSRSPQLLQKIGDAAQREFGDNCTVGRVFPAVEGDFYLQIMVYEEVNDHSREIYLGEFMPRRRE